MAASVVDPSEVPASLREPFDAGDAEQVRDRKKLAKLAQARADDAFRRLMSTADGRLWVWRFLAECQVFRMECLPNYGGQYFRDGERNVGLRLLDQINRLCPELYGVMQAENTESQHG